MRIPAVRLCGLLLVLALAVGACGRSPAPPPSAPDPVPPPDPSQVESVVFLLGDAGAARSDDSPVLARLQHDVEFWAGRLDAESAVALLVLGDVVYPVGLHPRGHPSFDADTAVVMAQVRVVLGPAALSRGARMFFMAGNHDWGSRKDWEGFVRLKNLDDFLAFARETTGAAVALVPEAGTGGPFVVDAGRHLRLILLDTAWWLLSADAAGKAAVLEEIDRAMETAGDREVVVAAHHPFRSVGPHGGFFPFWQTAGLRYILARSGAILQDLTSVPYRELERGLQRIFERHGPPLVFAGGHEHSLQVIEGGEANDPRFNLVSGSGSKLTDVGYEPGVRYADAVPGYMRLVIEKAGGVTLFVEAAPAEYLKCGGPDGARARCMAEGVAAFRTVYSQRLR
jgi:hypothetical protein